MLLVQKGEHQGLAGGLKINEIETHKETERLYLMGLKLNVD